MTLTKAKLVSKESLTPYVFKIILEPEQKFDFKAGQYIQVVMGEQDKRPFSIANSPDGFQTIELHIGATPENPYAFEVLQQLDQQQWLMLEIAHGIANVRESDLEAILIAGGTGYSYTKSVLFDILQSQPQRKVSLYWGAKTYADLYEADALLALSEENPQFTFIPVIENADESWSGKVGFVHRAAMSDISDYSNKQIYVAGRFEMAKVVKEDLLPLGLKPENLIGDAFAFI
jgi:aquacobalamin reductase/NAD(P)H-flavin reductase